VKHERPPAPAGAAAFLLACGALAAFGACAAQTRDPPPAHPPFFDYRDEAPGRSHRILVEDLPAPYATRSAGNGPRIVARPEGVVPRVPEGFRVNLFAGGFSTPRVLRTAPGGDVFLAESGAGKIRVFRGIDPAGGPQQSGVFASGFRRPYGIAFYPPGEDPRWIYVADSRAVWRMPYRKGQLRADAEPSLILELPFPGGHWTRDIRFSADGATMYVAVGSASNIDDPDTSESEIRRADILAASPEGAGLRIHAAGLRNASGLAIEPRSGRLWCVVNERDGLGDDLVPDYVTTVREGGFYGWPWWYIGAHQDPRHEGRHPELAARTIVPDVLLQPHTAPLQLEFYEGTRFPARYRGDIFATSHGSWNRSVRTGYEVLRVPLHQAGQTDGGYEDFMTGFVLPNGDVWGRPVGVAVASDGSLLVSDDESGSVWRVDFVGTSERK